MYWRCRNCAIIVNTPSTVFFAIFSRFNRCHGPVWQISNFFRRILISNKFRRPLIDDDPQQDVMQTIQTNNATLKMRLQLMTRWRSAAAALNRVSLANDELTRDSAVLPFCSSPRSSSLVLTYLTYLGVVLFLPLLQSSRIFGTGSRCTRPP